MNAIHTKLVAVFFLGSIAASQLFAGAGNNNPTGYAGAFNGDVTTGCNYDPYTANAARSITDLVVAGGVGNYPLAFTRVANSRYSAGQDDNGNGLSADFGIAGNWVHSYQWAIDSVTKLSGKPTNFTVRYDDGRIVTFTTATCGGGGGGGTCDLYYRGGQGVSDRLQVFWDSSSAGRAYLIKPDGGKVWFSIAITHPSGCSGCIVYTYTVQGIIDPYGQITTISGSPANFYPNSTGLVTVTEPGGRWIKLYYVQLPGDPWDYFIDHVTASDGRTVQYTYTTVAWYDQRLTQVTYFNDPTLVASYSYQADNTNAGGNALLRTCVDPMYAGPMWKIAYNYATGTNPDFTAVVYGQILSENYFDGTNIGAAVSTLTVVNSTTRKETRADGKTRTFTYNSTTGLLTSWTDFKGNGASQAYDSNGYVNAITDFNNHSTNFTKNAFTGGLLTATFPSTPEDTPPNTPRGVVTYTYGSTSCADPNNQDSNNPYYVCTVTDEGGHTTTYMRDTSKRVTHISYPDTGGQSFQYNSFGQVTSHTLLAGGIETFEYDTRGLLQKYRDAYHASPLNPNIWYLYDSVDRVSGVTDTLGSGPGDINHTTSFAYNSRGDINVTTLPVDPNDGQRHTITKGYNLANGTVTSVTDPLNHPTSFVYDDYKRPLTTTTPPRFSNDTMNHTGSVYYDANGTGNDYTHTDASPTWIVSPGGKKVKNAYDENLRKISVTVAFGTTAAATTTFGYDLNGNLISVVAAKEQPGQRFAGQSTVSAYDERNRPYSVTDPLGNVTSCTYDAADRKASATRANGQVVTFDSFDAMNRLRQSTAKQTPDPDAVTKYTYYTSGLLHTMQDPHLVAVGSGEVYNYQYDSMGRKTSLTYPRPTPSATPTSESWHYDTAGRVDTFTNRNGNTQRTLYDNLNRGYNVAWDDSGLTPTVTIGYDAASRVKAINNSSANISYVYFDDDLLSSETSTYADSVGRTVGYSYDPDANRASIQYPANAYSFTYDYTGRNQPWHVLNNSTPIVTNVYDPDGNLVSSTPDTPPATSSFIYDGLDRLTHITHALNGTTRTFDYAYDSVSNRKWQQRDGAKGDVFGYDLADQSTSILPDVLNPGTTAPGPQTIYYDANGNRTTFSAYGPTDTYSTNNLNQYTQRNSSTAGYDTKGNMTTGLDGSSYAYDAQNRILTASKGGTNETFKYDGLNRQVSRQIGTAQPVYNVYDGWNLIGEYALGAGLPTVAYLGGLKNLTGNLYYYHDGGGSTSHLADNTGHLLESYRYDLQGTPLFYDASGNPVSASNFSVRHLFTGQQWYSELGLYDLRNRFYSPDIGRFLQGDPLVFGGGDSNLYRYCGNNSSTNADPLGLWYIDINITGGFIFGVTGGLQINSSGVYPYLGGGLVTPGVSASVTGSLQDPSPETWSIGLQAADVITVQVGRTVGSEGEWFLEGGGGFPPGASLTTFYTFPSLESMLGSSGSASYSPDVTISPTDPGGYIGADGIPVMQRVTVEGTPVYSGPAFSGAGGISQMYYQGLRSDGYSAAMAATIAGHIASAEVSAAIEMGGWATSPGPLRGVAVSESDRQPHYRAPFMTWWGAPAQYATAYKWVAYPTMMVINSGGVKGYYKPIAWSTDPSAYVAPPTTTPRGHPIGTVWYSGRR
jgi:RHS repeat-associated protein